MKLLHVLYVCTLRHVFPRDPINKKINKFSTENMKMNKKNKKYFQQICYMLYVMLLCVHCHHIKYPFLYPIIFSFFFMNNLHDFNCERWQGEKAICEHRKEKNTHIIMGRKWKKKHIILYSKNLFFLRKPFSY